MIEYQKINTVFKRDINNIIIPTKFTCEEFEYLKDLKFEATEKVDGTNISVQIDFGVVGTKPIVRFCGRTERADIPTELNARLHEIFDSVDWNDIFPNAENTTVCVYGEGYGRKINKYGKSYISTGVDFILFDVRIGSWWLKRDACEDVAEKLGINIVPIIGYFSIPEAMEYVNKGFKSTISENKDLDAEGLVLKTPCGLRFRNGERIILKIKTKDFRDFTRRYGDDWNTEQQENPKYN